MQPADLTELQIRRAELGLNQAELAAKAGVFASEISRWERFQAEPRGEDRKAYAAALGWSVEELGAVIYRNTAGPRDQTPSVGMAVLPAPAAQVEG